MFRRFMLGVVFALFAPAIGMGSERQTDACLDLQPEARFVESMMGADETRVALVIGNGEYESISRLPNPPNDASAVAERLRILGFRVFLLLDGRAEAVAECLHRATPHYEGADIGVLYYAGHGIQVQDENFVIGVDAPADLDAASGLVPVTSLIEPIRKAKVALIFLDACRTNPYDETLPQGLAVADARIVPIVKPGELDTAEGSQPSGMMIAYATSPNAVALDGSGDHSPFTQAFLDEMGRPGHSLQQSLSEIGKLVGEATDFLQTPWSRSSLTSLLFMNGTIADEDVAAASAAWIGEAYELNGAGEKDEALLTALKGFPAVLSSEHIEPFGKSLSYIAGLIGSDVLKLDEAVAYKAVNNIAFSLDGERVAMLLEDPAVAGAEAVEVRILDRRSGLTLSSGDSITVLVNELLYFTQDSAKLVAVDYTGDVWIWDAATGQLLSKLIDPAGPSRKEGKIPQVEFVRLNADATHVAALSQAGDFLRVTDVASGRVMVSVLEDDLGTPRSNGPYASFNQRETEAFFVSNGGSVVMALVGTECADGMDFLHYDLATGALTRRVVAQIEVLEQCRLRATSLSDDGSRALVEISVDGEDNQIAIVDTASGAVIHQRSGRAEWGHVLTPDGEAIYVPAHYMGGSRLLIPLGGTVAAETEGLIAQESASGIAPDGMLSGIGDPLQAVRWYRLPPGLALLDALTERLSVEQKAELARDRLRWYPLS